MQQPEPGIPGRNILPDQDLFCIKSSVSLAHHTHCTIILLWETSALKKDCLGKNHNCYLMTVRQRRTRFLYCYSSKLGMQFIICLLKRILSPSKSSSHLSKIFFILGPKFFAHTWFVLMAKKNHWVLRENENPDLQKPLTFQLNRRNI